MNKEEKPPKRAKIGKPRAKPPAAPHITLLENVLKIDDKFLLKIRKMLKDTEMKQVEHCGSFVINGETGVISIDGPVYKGINEIDVINNTRRGRCIRKKTTLCNFHTHYEGLEYYPSSQDLLLVLENDERVELLFTPIGFWIIRNKSVDRYYYMHMISAELGGKRTWTATKKALEDIYELNHFNVRPDKYDLKVIKEYIKYVEKYVKGLHLTFIPWSEYLDVHPSQRELLTSGKKS